MTADIGNPLVWFENDSSNTGGATQPAWPEGMPAKNVNDAARAMMGAIKRWYDQLGFTLTATGSASNIVLHYTKDPDALYDGQRFSFIPAVDCAVTPTLNINSLGTKTIRKYVAGVLTDLSAGDIQAGTPTEVMYSVATSGYILLGVPSAFPTASLTVAGIIMLASRAEVELGDSADLNAVTPASLVALWGRGNDEAGAASIVLDEGGFFHVTGADWSATPCTSITFTDPSGVGRKAKLLFEGIGKLTNGVSLILPTAADINVEAGDIAEILLDTGSVTRVTGFTRASGRSLVGGNYINVYKTVDQALAVNSSAFVDDPDLQFTVKSGKTYNFRAQLFLSCAVSTQGFKLGFIPATALTTYKMTSRGVSNTGTPTSVEDYDTGTTAITDATLVSSLSASGGQSWSIVVEGVIVGGAADSLIKIRWANNSVDASGTHITTISKDSYISYQER